jgi:hypothetical protein
MLTNIIGMDKNLNKYINHDSTNKYTSYRSTQMHQHMKRLGPHFKKEKKCMDKNSSLRLLTNERKQIKSRRRGPVSVNHCRLWKRMSLVSRLSVKKIQEDRSITQNRLQSDWAVRVGGVLHAFGGSLPISPASSFICTARIPATFFVARVWPPYTHLKVSFDS